ncbi:hypothetical protein H257_03627 [Aphanomyces astaci]|uniref:Uncharacterized protein n=1 Tax=Aphanomyces astaci TaxID=112090 RepID=W4GXF2_APHAT|nr:hypothetical protein H257_03627 [Aphanomyces astaci]ETV84410.1 hypothetical protein H257_03627 [Aphanomyces astaci]|eukprot:XP_009826102.1 hypothetical protein H257_03627 [Aphanomyces astaci]
MCLLFPVAPSDTSWFPPFVTSSRSYLRQSCTSSIMRTWLVGALTGIFAAVVVQGHSWIECSNYVIQSDADKNYYNPKNCVGFPRCAAARGDVFGFEGPLQYQQTTKSCQCSRDASNAYTAANPKAKYTPGQRVCLAYPAKNHVADSCTNQYIPDSGMRIYRSDKGETADPALFKWPHEYNHLNGVHVNGVIDYKGFQNCPKFCEQKDKALCTVCFDLEPDLAVGAYSFHWEWSFNPGQDRYVSCWEVDVVTGSAPSPSVTPNSNTSPTSPPSKNNYPKGGGDELECDE